MQTFKEHNWMLVAVLKHHQSQRWGEAADEPALAPKAQQRRLARTLAPPNGVLRLSLTTAALHQGGADLLVCQMASPAWTAAQQRRPTDLCSGAL